MHGLDIVETLVMRTGLAKRSAVVVSRALPHPKVMIPPQPNPSRSLQLTPNCHLKFGPTPVMLVI